MKTKTVKVITTLIAVSAIAVISGVSYIAYTYNEKLDTIKGTIEEQVTVDLQDYFTEYVNQSTMESGTLENTVDNLQQNTNKIYLSTDQVNAIVDSVVNQVTPGLLKQIVSTNQAITLKSIEALEKEIDEKLQSIIPENTLSESEMKELADMVSLIVESNILKEYSKAEDMTVELEELEILKNSIINKLKQINLAIDTYENKVVDLEKELKNLKNEGASVDELIALEERIASAYRSLESFAVKSSKAITIVDDLMTGYDVEGGVVSAEDGHDLLTRLQELNNKLSVTASSLSANMENLQYEIATLNENISANEENISSLQTQLTDKTTELQGKIDEKQSLVDAQAALSMAQADLTNLIHDEAATRTEALAQAEAARDALSVAIAQAGDKASGDLIAAKEALETSINNSNSSISDLSISLSNAKTALEGNIATIEVNIEEINDEIVGLNTSITQINGNISNLNQNVNMNTNDISTLKNQMTDNSSEISGLKNKNAELNGLITSTNSSLQALEAATDVNDATTAVAQAIAAAELSANTTAAANLQNAKTEIEQAYASGDTASINTATQNAKDLISSLNTDLTDKITANEIKIANLNTSVTNMQNQISTKASQQDLIDLKDGLDNGAKTTYSFSGSGSNATVTITVPAS